MLQVHGAALSHETAAHSPQSSLPHHAHIPACQASHHFAVCWQTLRKEPLVVTLTERFWAPSPWFVVVLTVSVALLLVALAWLAWKLLCR